MTDFPPLPVLDELTEAERGLVEAARRGLLFAPGAPVRALVLRELLLGLRGPLDPRGVRVEDARIAGTLNLDHVEAGVGLALLGCVVVNPVGARHARLPWLDLSGSRIAGFDGDGVRIDHDLDLTGVRATGSGEFGVICLRNARVDGLTRLSDAVLTSEDGPAVYLDGLETRTLRGVGLRATGAGGLGAVRLLGAHVSGQADFDDAVLTNASGPAMHADGVVVDGDLRLAGATVTGAGEEGALRLLGARVGDEVDFTGAELTNNTGPAVEADRLRCGELRLTGVRATASSDGATISVLGARVDGQVNLGDGVLTNNRGCALRADGIQVGAEFHADDVHATGAGEYGVLCLLSAHVGSHLYLEGAELTNKTGAALSGDRLRIDGVLGLGGATATGAGEQGTIRLLSARIDGHLELQETRIASDSGPALHADGLRVGRNLFFTDGHVTGAGEDGAIRLRGAEVVSQLLAGGLAVRNGTGPAVSAEDLRVGTYLDFSGLTAGCSSEHAAVSLSGARIDGKLTLDGAELTNTAGPALTASRCEVRESLALSEVRATGAGDSAVVGLLGARVGGRLSFTGAEIGHPDGGTLVSLEDVVVEGPVFLPAEVAGSAGLVHLDGFRFGALADVTWREWLSLVRDRTADYRPGPYQQLAAAERAAGHDGNARHVLIAQQRDLYRRSRTSIGGWPARRFHWLWGALAGYGYRARRTAAALLLAVVAAGGLGLWAGHVGDGSHRAAERVTDLTAKVGTPCTTVELIGVGLDRGLPLSPGVRGRCDLNTGTTSGQVFTVAIWAVQAAIWALATLALVGYTGLVRKTS
ncbi:hypothetical protein ACIA5G_15210 [Amycolatopsis sp. NPDC051758]|uniref:hypothetical protein n=1 Tax=Amycolatopsis sp. NPDC051758 TaxID=3363935 RepID=UPI0037B15E56